MKRLIVVIASLIFLLGIFNVSLKLPVKKTPVLVALPTYAPKPNQLDSDKLWSLVQNWRTSQGLQPYIKDQNMCNIASQRAIEIQKDFSHNGFSSSRLCGTRACHVGENLSENYYSEQDTLNAWLNSPEHLFNLKDSFTNSCIECSGLYCAQEFVTYVTQSPTPTQTTQSDTEKAVMVLTVQNCLNQSFQAVSNMIAQANANGAPLSADQIKNLDQIAENNCKTPTN